MVNTPTPSWRDSGRQEILSEPDTDVTIEWLGGHFVGEGSIVARIDHKNPYNCGVPKSYINLVVTTTVEEEVRAYKDYFGVGDVRFKKKHGENNQDQFDYTANGEVTKLILPRLKRHFHRGPKELQAEYALEFLQGVDTGRGGNNEMSAEEAKRRLRLAKKIRALTQRCNAPSEWSMD